MNHANMNLRRFRPSEREDDNTRLLVGLGYVPILFFLPLIVRPDSKPGRHTANQGLSLLALTILLSIVKAILGVIPIVRVVTNIILIAAIVLVWAFAILQAYIYYKNGTLSELPYSLRVFH